MAQNNSIDNRTSQLTVDPGAAGDSFVQFDINTTNEFIIGVDDDDGDAFKISQGGALGTNDRFNMSAAGERRMASNPCFLAVLTSDESNVTGTGTLHTLGSVVSLTSIFDQGSNLSSLNPVTFTAPVTGRYLITYNCSFRGVTTGVATSCGALIVTSNRTYRIDNGYLAATSAYGLNMCVVADMDVSDTATFQAFVSGQVSDSADMDGSTSVLTGVSGCLIS